MNRRSRGRSPYGTSAFSHNASHTSPNSSGRAPSSPLPSDKNIFEGLDTKCIEMLTVPSLDTTDAVVDIRTPNTLAPTTGSRILTLHPTSRTHRQQYLCLAPHQSGRTRAVPYGVPPDSGTFFSDQNGFQMPSAILLPLMVAVETVIEDKKEPPFDWSSVDFVTDRNCLRKLLRWIGGGNNEKSLKEFRIDMQLSGEKTVLLNRWDNRYRVQASGYTYGYSFENHTTKPASGCESSTGHHRIITYDLGGFKMVVRFEVDACIPTKPARITKHVSVASSSSSLTTADALADLLSKVKIGSPTTSVVAVTPSRSLTVKSGGSYVPQSAILELTTVSERRRSQFDWYEQYPQLFLSQTPCHFLGIHNVGQFRTVEKNELSALANQARMVQPSMKKLVKVLRTIQALVVKKGKTGRLTLIRDGEWLRVYERRSQEGCLPEEYLAKFEQTARSVEEEFRVLLASLSGRRARMSLACLAYARSSPRSLASSTSPGWLNLLSMRGPIWGCSSQAKRAEPVLRNPGYYIRPGRETRINH
ncbi:hypothetical protein F5146DRAFT_1144172 [Armillaria mellea]|nr:hypothetical protein F5146DRAFT_1144172 [Armillaria mellea]